MPGNITLTHTDATFTTSSIYIFGRNGDSMSGNIYQFKIWDDGILSHDFQPAIRNSDNKVGFLDLITNTFFTHNSWTAIEVADTVENDCAGWLHELNANGFTFNNQYINAGPRYDRAINFTTAAQYLQGISFDDNIRAISLWFKLGATFPSSWQCLFADKNNTVAFGWGSSMFVTRALNSEQLFDISNYKLNDWNFVIINYSSNHSTHQLFINNEEITSRNTHSDYFNHQHSFLVNARAYNGNPQNGASIPMSDLRVYATELTEEDRNRLYAMGRV